MQFPTLGEPVREIVSALPSDKFGSDQAAKYDVHPLQRA